MSQSDDIIEGARTIRPYLNDLLGSDAGKVDGELARLLARHQEGERVDTHIYEVLAQHKQTQRWMSRFLLDQTIDIEEEKGFDPISGNTTPIIALRYACPNNDYVWYRRSVEQPIPLCPTHKVLLAAVQR